MYKLSVRDTLWPSQWVYTGTTDHSIRWHFLHLEDRDKYLLSFLWWLECASFLVAGHGGGGWLKDLLRYSHWPQRNPTQTAKKNTSFVCSMSWPNSTQRWQRDAYLQKCWTQEVGPQPWPEFVNKPREHCEIHPPVQAPRSVCSSCMEFCMIIVFGFLFFFPFFFFVK